MKSDVRDLRRGTSLAGTRWPASKGRSAMLAGSRVLVVEDEALIAMGISAMLTDAEAVPVGPAASVREARQLIRDVAVLDAAVLDVNLADGSVTPILEALSARGIPTVIYTGGVVPEDVRHRHPNLVALSKPVLPARLIGELRKAIGPARPHRSWG
ncbi:response regulator [Microvirga sp. VF16]|uniref:response regulator n=1 Tax=Microvirga sp. VF16 TaxID=2807101 RepID=UPI00193DD8C0|nr:response regulator [Microvirga sp. VF16]QRM34381.1 response regulator [Microvirga sp. VF16]